MSEPEAGRPTDRTMLNRRRRVLDSSIQSDDVVVDLTEDHADDRDPTELPSWIETSKRRRRWPVFNRWQ